MYQDDCYLQKRRSTSGSNLGRLPRIDHTKPQYFSDSEEQTERKVRKRQKMDRLAEFIAKLTESQQMMMESQQQAQRMMLQEQVHQLMMEQPQDLHVKKAAPELKINRTMKTRTSQNSLLCLNEP